MNRFCYVNFELGTLQIPEGRQTQFKTAQKKQFKSLHTGQLVDSQLFLWYDYSTKLVIGNLVKSKTRNLYKAIEQQSSLNSGIEVSSYNSSVQKLFFWKSNFEN